MADELGTAVLRVTVDDSQARESLRLLRQDVARSSNAGSRRGGSSANSAASKAERDLEVLKEKRFRLARRIDALEENGVKTSRLRAQLGRLTTAYAERDFALARKYARELARAATLEERRTQSAARRRREEERVLTRGPARGLDRVPLQGSIREIGSPRFINNAIRQGGPNESIDALFTAQKRRYNLDQQIRSLEAAGVNTDKLRVELGRVTEAQAQRRFGTAKQLGEQLAFQLKKERDILNTRLAAERVASREARAADAEGRRIGRLNASPVTGRTPTGPIPGSPAAINAAAAQRRRELQEGYRIGKLNTSPVKGGAAFPGSPAFLDSIFPAFPTKQLREREKLLAQNPLRLVDATSQALTNERRLERQERRFERQERRLERQKRRQAEDRAGRRVNNLVSSAVIGGAFPLLFGQGGGAAAGGLFGGLLGGAVGGAGGFAGSLLGTVIGSTADKFGELGKALQDPVKNLDLLTQNANLSSKGVEQLAQALVDAGRTAEATALLQADLAKTIDPVGALKLVAANDAYSRSIADVQERLGYLLAGPAVQFTDWLTGIINRVANIPQGGPTRESALATRGQGAALGIGGFALSVGGALTGNLPVALAGAGLAATGQAQIAAAEFQEQQVADAKIIEAAQQRIAEIEQRRLNLQRGIASATSRGRTALAEQLSVQNQLAALDAQYARARTEALASPGVLTKAQLESLRLTKEAIELQKKGIIENANLRVREAQKAANQEASDTQKILSLDGVRLDIAQRRNALDKLQRERDAAFADTLSVSSADTASQNLTTIYETAATVFDTEIRKTTAFLVQSAAEIGKRLQDAQLRLSELRADPQGLSRFLSPDQQFQRNRNAILDLAPQLERAIRGTQDLFIREGLGPVQNERFQGLRDIIRGAREGSFASQAGVQQISDFVQRFSAETTATRDVQQANADLAAVNQELSTVNTALKTEIANLVAKTWNIDVNVAANGQVTAYGDLLNGAFPGP